MRAFVERNMTASILVLSLLGFILPFFESVPTITVDVIVALVIFIACFRIDFKEILYVNYFSLAWFYILRFIILPLAVYYTVYTFSSIFALALLLLTLLPPATATPALTQIFQGDIALSFAFVVGASLFTPLVLPIIFYFTVGKSVHLNILAMWLTLVITLFFPALIFYGVRKNIPIVNFINKNGSFSAIILIGLAFAIAIGKQKKLIMHDPLHLLSLFLIAAAMFFIFYVVGWLIAYRKNKVTKITYMLSSGAINISLGVSLSLLYFSAETTMLLVIGQFAWIFALTPLKIFINKVN